VRAMWGEQINKWLRCALSKCVAKRKGQFKGFGLVGKFALRN
jgi:hypothetical protein